MSEQIKYKKIMENGVKSLEIEGKRFLKIESNVLRELAEKAFHDVEFYLRSSHLNTWAEILDDDEASDNDKYVCANLIKNAIIASEGNLPLCQDTGTATVFAWRGENIITDGDDVKELEKGIEACWKNNCLRYSQVAPITMFEEKNTGNNMPAQIDISYDSGNEYRFLFMAKGGGSANKTVLYQGNKALLNEDALYALLKEKISGLGVAACPPYTIVVVVGGTSPEFNLKIMKLASAGWYDDLPTIGDGKGTMFRDKEWESKILKIASETGWGAQFGGKYMAIEARVIRLARHGGSCPVSIGVSCSAHRNILAKINSEGVFLEELDKNPSRLLRRVLIDNSKAPKIDLDKPMNEVLKELGKYHAGSLVLLNGTLIVARDMAHAKIHDIVLSGKPVPEYFKKHPIYYAGPAKTPKGYVIGSFGPTTAQRMDGYIDFFMQRKASMVTLAKGNRAESVVNACKKYGGFYLGTIGGAAALIAAEHIISSEVIEFPEFGMEAVHKIVVKNLSAFIIYDNSGNRLY